MTPQDMLLDINKWKNDTNTIATGLYNMVNHLPTDQEWDVGKAGDETLHINGLLVMYCPKSKEYMLLNDAPKYGPIWFTQEPWKMAYFLLGYLNAKM